MGSLGADASLAALGLLPSGSDTLTLDVCTSIALAGQNRRSCQSVHGTWAGMDVFYAIYLLLMLAETSVPAVHAAGRAERLSPEPGDVLSPSGKTSLDRRMG